MYLGTFFTPMFFVLAYFIKSDPVLLERRLRMCEKETAHEKSSLSRTCTIWLPSSYPAWMCVLAGRTSRRRFP